MKLIRKNFLSILILLVVILSPASFAQNYFFHLLGIQSLPPFTWTGAAGDHKWSSSGNWSTHVVPGSGTIAQFLGIGCAGVACNSTLDVDPNVGGINITSDFGGTISQSAGLAVTIGTAGWTQAGGTFTGSNTAMTMAGNFNLSGGTFTATTDIITLKGNLNVGASGTFTPSTGTISFYPPDGSSLTVTPGPNAYNNVDFYGWDPIYDLGGTTMTVGGTLTLRSRYRGYLNSGTIIAKGNFTTDQTGYQGTINIKIGGSGNQTVTGVDNEHIPALEIASTGGTVSLAGILFVNGNYTYTSGTVNAGTSTLHLRGPDATHMSIAPGNVNYYAVTFDGYQTWYDLGGGTLKTSGALTLENQYFSGTLDNGTLLASGEVTASVYGYGGSALIRLVGTGNQTLTGVSTAVFPAIEIASTGGTVSLVGVLILTKVFNYTSGTLNAGTSTLDFRGADYSSNSIVLGSTTFYNITFEGYGVSYDFGGATLKISGTLALSDLYGHSNLNSVTILLTGNLSAAAQGESGSALIRLVGSSSQSFSGISGAAIPNIEIASTGGTVTLSGTLQFEGNYTYTSGTVDSGTSLVVFAGADHSNVSLALGSQVFHDVNFSGYAIIYDLNASTPAINGTLSFENGYGGSINSGTLIANGDFTGTGAGYGGSAILKLSGGTTTNFLFQNNISNSGFIVNKTAGSSVNLGVNLTLGGASQSVSITSGGMDMKGYSLTIPSLTLAGHTLTKSTGALVVNGVTIGTGSLFGGTIAP